MPPPASDAPQRRRRLRRAALIALPGIVVATLVSGFFLTLYLTARAERLHPATGEVVEVEGLRQHYLERGARGSPSIVLLHGAFGALQDFEATVLDELAERYHCIAWDRPGHGYSERPADEVCDPGVQARILLGLVRELALERPLIVGFSYGGAVALATALDGAEQIRGAVLLNGPSHPWPDPIDLEYRLPSYPIIGPLVTSTLLSPLGHLLMSESIAGVFAPESVAPHYAKSPVQLTLRPTSYAANAADICALKPYLAAQVERYAGLRVPISMVVSEQDSVVSPTIHSLQLAEAAPQFEMIRIDGAGHQILYTRPEIVVGAIVAAMP